MTVYLIVDYKGDVVKLVQTDKSKEYVIIHHNGCYTGNTLAFLNKKTLRLIKRYVI